MDVRKTLANVNGLSIPGISRDGLFIGESPVSSFVQYRAVNLDVKEPRTILIEHPCVIDTILISDASNGTQYDFSVVTTEGFTWVVTIPTTQIINFGTTRIINFPDFVLDKGYRLIVIPNNPLAGVVVFTRLAINVDIRDF